MTTAKAFAQALEQVAAVRARCPELRFGQLLATIGMLAEDETGHGLWDVEDADFIAALERFSADLARRGAHPAEPGPTPDGRMTVDDGLSGHPVVGVERGKIRGDR